MSRKEALRAGRPDARMNRLGGTWFHRLAATRDVVLLCVAVALIGVAVLHFATSNPMREEPPDDDASRVTFVCQACGQQFTLTGREIHEATQRMQMQSPRESAAGDEVEEGFPCPHCGKFAGVRPPPVPD